MAAKQLVWKMNRARSGSMDSATYVSRSKPFGSAVRDLREATLLTIRTQVGVECYMITPGRRPDLSAKAAEVLAHAVGAKAVQAESLPDTTGGPVVARLVARPTQSASRDSQAGADPTEVAQTIARTAEPGSWLAVTLRRPVKREVDRTREWNHRRHASYTHHSLDSEVLVASFYAGAPSESAATFLLGQVVAALPGMDVDVVSKVPSDTPVAIGSGLAAATTVGLGAFGEFYAPGMLAENAELVTRLEGIPMLWGGLGLGLPLGALSWAAGTHRLPTAAQRLRKASQQLSLPAPPVGGRAAPKPKPTQDGSPPPTPPNPYPLANTAFLVGPSVVAGVVAPQGGAEAGAASTGMRGAPPALLEDVGPMIGETGSGQRVHISSGDRNASVMVLGIPDAGKLEPLDSRVPVPVSDRFPDGWATIGDLDVDDLVYTQDGTVTRVVRLAPVIETPDLFDVRFIDGQVVTADANHLWKVSTSLSRVARTGRREQRRAKVRAANLAEAERFRELAAELGSGAFATIGELATLCGRHQSDVSRFVARLGLPAQEVSVPCSSSRSGNGGVVVHEGRRTARVYPCGEFLLAHAEYIESRGDQARAGMRPVQPVEQIMTTRQMLDQLRTSDGKNNLAVRLVSLAAPEADLPVDPYVLGAWLGDGDSSGGSFTAGDSDTVLCLDPETGLSDREHLMSQLVHFQPRVSGTKRVHTSGLSPLLKTLGVRQNKHIPPAYLRASFEQRLALLQGLMDTDGTVDGQGACELTLCDEQLADGALELVRSLGIKAGRSVGPAGYRDADGQYVACKDRHRIHFSPRVQVFRLPRKARRVRLEVEGDQSRWLPIVDITPAASRPGRCITVDDPSGMYLTGHFVPTHNSVAIRSLYAWNVLERVSPSGREDRPGRDNTLIAFENKGEGAGEYVKWGKELGDHPLRIDLADRSTPAIDLFAGPATPMLRAKQVAEAMQYAFPEGSIQSRSLSTLTIVLTAAQFVTPQVAEWADLPGTLTVVEAAHVLLGARGDEPGVRLATALTRAQLGSEDRHLADAVQGLAPLYGEGVTKSQRNTLQDAPRTKIETLVEANDWFALDRPRIAWADILRGSDNVVVNTGISASGELVSAEVTKVMGSMMLYTLRDSIQRVASGWKDQGRTISIFVDELALLAEGSPEVVTWLRNQGRSYGIAQYLATQYPDQLHDQVRKAVLSFGTVYWFRQSNPQIAEMASTMLSVDGSDWRPSDVYNLPAHTAIVAAQVHKAAQPAVPVKIGYWEPDRGAYPEIQGYPSGGSLPEPERDVQVPVQDDGPTSEVGEDVPDASPPVHDEPPPVLDDGPVAAPEFEGDPFAPDRFGQ